MGKLDKIANNLIVLGGAGLLFGSSFMFIVNPGEAAIKFNSVRGGVKKDVYKEGLHFKLPLVDNIIRYDTRIKPVDITSITSTKDQQQIDITLRVLYRPIEDEIPNIHLNLGTQFQDKFVRPIALEVIKTVLAQYDTDQLLKQRDKISSEIKSLYTARTKEFHLVIEDVALTDLTFSAEFKKSIENKQIAQQNAEMARYVVEMKEQQFKANIIETEGKSEAARLILEAKMQYGDAYIKLKKLQAARRIAENLSMNPNVAFVPQKNNFLFQL
jgi:prohibitin 1